jgi:spore germination protein YaaH
LAVAILLLAATMIVTALKLPNLFGGDPSEGPQVVASLPVWNLEGGSETITAHASSFTAASPSVYEVSPAGEIVLRPQPDGVSAADCFATLRERDVPIMPIISNTHEGAWEPQLIQTILHDPNLVQRHVDAIVTLVLEEEFAGIDIDYENLTADDRDVFSRFIAQLADALHAEDKILSVDVFAKESDEGYDARNLAQDYAALGRAADQVRLMAYDRHWQTSPAGPIAPLNWVRSVLSYAVSEIPKHKIVLGLPTYGYNWIEDNGQLVSWQQAYGLSQKLDVPVRWDPAAQSPWLTYQDEQGVRRTIWFENTFSITTKLELAQSYDIGGVFLWLVGDEDDGVWPVISDFANGETVQVEGTP